MLSRRILLRSSAHAAHWKCYSRAASNAAAKPTPLLPPNAPPPSDRPLDFATPDPAVETPKPFLAPPTWKRRTPQWLLNNPTFVSSMQVVAKLLGHNSKTTTAIRETRMMYQACAEREVKEAGFIYVECRLAPTFQTWFSFTNLHVWLLTTRFRALPPPYGRLYIQELLNHFFLDAEYRLRSVHGPKCPERIIKRNMVDLRDMWSGMTASYDLALLKGDTELAAAVWRNVFAARGEKAYKEKDLSEEEREKLIEDRRKNNDPETDGAALEEIPRLVHLYVSHLRREVLRLEEVPDDDILAGNLGKFGRVGSLTQSGTPQAPTGGPAESKAD